MSLLTSAYIDELQKPFIDSEETRKKDKERLEQEIFELEQEVVRKKKEIDDLVRDKRRALSVDGNKLRTKMSALKNDEKYRVHSTPQFPSSVQRSSNYVEGSELYETEDGGLVASLPEEHPVIKEIEIREAQRPILEKLDKGTKNLLEVLRKEEARRQPIDWNYNDILNLPTVPEGLRNLILFDKEWQGAQARELMSVNSGAYVMALFPEIFKDEAKDSDDYKMFIKFHSDFEENGGGFTGLSFNYKNDMYLIMKNGKRYCLKDFATTRYYPHITKYGPDCETINRDDGRLIFTNYLFKKNYRDRDDTAYGGRMEHRKYMVKHEAELTTDFVEKTVDSDKILNGIDPNTYYDESTRCLVFGRPLFMPYIEDGSRSPDAIGK